MGMKGRLPRGSEDTRSIWHAHFFRCRYLSQFDQAIRKKIRKIFVQSYRIKINSLLSKSVLSKSVRRQVGWLSERSTFQM